ncbi:MAG: ethanolamine ammonia-lyase, partial [Planctomycetales bacterium 12-60-4]
FGDRPSDLAPQLRRDIQRIYDDAKVSIWAEFDQRFQQSMPDASHLQTRSVNRSEYILHPETGEVLSAASIEIVRRLREQQAGQYDVQVVISDGLNALSIMEQAQLQPFLESLRAKLQDHGFRAEPQPLVVTSGRVRAGYRIGELLFSGLAGPRALVHVIGERPGSGHRTFSVYLTAPQGIVWGTPGKVDHNLTRVVAGIANTALAPRLAADEVVRLLTNLRQL